MLFCFESARGQDWMFVTPRMWQWLNIFIRFYLKMDIQLWVIYSHWPIFFAVFMKCLISTALYSNSKNTALHFDFIACLRHHNACSLLFLMRWIFICMHQRYLRSALANIHIYTIEGNRTAFVSNQATFLYLWYHSSSVSTLPVF